MYDYSNGYGTYGYTSMSHGKYGYTGYDSYGSEVAEHGSEVAESAAEQLELHPFFTSGTCSTMSNDG